MSGKPRILALIGPTASGKSDLALELAQKHGAEILSCDSLLIYKGLNIGTAKPSTEELARVPHHAIDLLEPSEPYTAGDYARYARPIVDRLVASNKPVLIVGGTGFYLKALLCGVWDAPPTHPEIRARLESEVAHLSEEERALTLHRKLEALDPEYAAKVMVNDVYRVIRGLEIIEVSGEKVSELLKKRELQNPLPYPFTILGISRNKISLERRIVERTNQMFAKGIVAETKEMLQHYQPIPRSFFCVGYNEVMQFLDGHMTLAECRERIVISTRQLAKKQMTFFKTFPAPIQWFNLPGEDEQLRRAADEVLA